MIHLDYRDSRPMYEQIKDGFRRLIVQGLMETDDKLPSVRELASSLAINPNTIQRAYRELEREGYVYVISGKGSFVAGVPERDSVRKKELLEKFGQIIEELFYLGISEEEMGQEIRRVRGEITEREGKGGKMDDTGE